MEQGALKNGLPYNTAGGLIERDILPLAALSDVPNLELAVPRRRIIPPASPRKPSWLSILHHQDRS
jgi:hypothetical protein